MRTNLSAFQGCLLGLAVGDAMGCSVDAKTYEEICADYGPNGLLGYDLANGCAEISSYTQIAAFVCNAFLRCVTAGKVRGPYMPFIAGAMKEWARSQYFPKDVEGKSCWLCHVPQMRSRKCMDARALDALTRDVLGTVDAPANRAANPGTLTAAVSVGLFFHPERMQADILGRLGAETVALTHGDPLAFLSGSVLAYTVAGIIHSPETPLAQQFTQAAEAVATQFARFPQARTVADQIGSAVALAESSGVVHADAMEQLECMNAAQVLAGAAYACLASGGDFDSAMIIAINHSGKSAAVGAVAGAVLGAHLGQEALPEFYLECLDCVEVLRELAGDYANLWSKSWAAHLFDDDWDKKYTQGQPVDKDGWAEG